MAVCLSLAFLVSTAYRRLRPSRYHPLGVDKIPMASRGEPVHGDGVYWGHGLAASSGAVWDAAKECPVTPPRAERPRVPARDYGNPDPDRLTAEYTLRAATASKI